MLLDRQHSDRASKQSAWQSPTSKVCSPELITVGNVTAALKVAFNIVYRRRDDNFQQVHSLRVLFVLIMLALYYILYRHWQYWSRQGPLLTQTTVSLTLHMLGLVTTLTLNRTSTLSLAAKMTALCRTFSATQWNVFVRWLAQHSKRSTMNP